MTDNIVASVQLGWLLAAGFGLAVLGGLTGWLVANWRGKKQESLRAGNQVNSSGSDISQLITRNLTHELRTPLTAILGHVEILNSCTIEEETLWRRSLGFVNTETERLAHLVEELFYLSRLERGPLDLCPADLYWIAEQAMATLAEQAEKNRVSFVLEASRQLPPTVTDPDRIRQVFINLLDNAVKYAPGGIVTIRLAQEKDYLKVQIIDQGPGISAEDLPHIFEPFYRSQQTATRARGSGLGLAIVLTILVQHRTTIEVNSSPGAGTAFCFSLPISR